MRMLILTAILLTATAAPALAQTNRSGTVSVCSRFSGKCASAPVRPSRFGSEVRLPGGTWISCAGSCKDTLRDETIDFWAKRDFERGAPDRGRRTR
jgi:hypothetical protein